MKQLWQNKTAVVCGASAGLGWHLALELAAQGAHVVMLARDQEKLSAARTLICSQHPSANVVDFAVDVSNLAQLHLIVERIAQLGHVNLVINAVGKSDRGSLSGLTAEHLESLFKTNVTSSLAVLQAFTPLLRQSAQASEQSVLVFIGSLSSHFAPRFLGGYSITKHALAALTQQARLELADDGIHVMLASPGPIDRDDRDSRYNHLAQTGVPDQAMKSGGGAKLKRLCPSQVSRTILQAAAAHRCTILIPCKAKVLLVLSGISTKLGDFLLRKMTS